jgi:16S rRNA (guanine527-N7)-methyltransferase
VAAADPRSPALSELADRWGLSQPKLDQLGVILAVLELDDRAPTTVREPARALDAHLADSLVALDVGAVAAAGTIADIGSGAGFPGLALAVAREDCEVSLVESHGRKCGFLDDMVARVKARNVQVVCARAEEWRQGISAIDVVTARAVGPQPVVLEYAAPLLRLGGTLVDWRGRRDTAQERRAERAAEELGLGLVAVERVQPFAAARDRHLYVYEKVTETPSRFPRRAGMARKRPLGG